MADGRRSPQMEEVVVRPDDGPSPQHQSVRSWENAVRGGYYESAANDERGVNRLPNLSPEDAAALAEDKRYFDLIEGEQIPRKNVESMLAKGYTPKEIYRLWIDRTPALPPRTINLGPDRFSLDPINLPQLPPANQPEWAPEPAPDPEAGNAAKHVLTRVIVKLFPKPLQYLVEAGFFAYEIWNAFPELQEYFQDAYDQMDDDLMSWADVWFNNQRELGTEIHEIPGASVTIVENPKRSIRDFNFQFPLDNLQILKPPKPGVIEVPPTLDPQRWMPEPQPWPSEFPEELPEIAIEVSPTWITDPQTNPKQKPKSVPGLSLSPNLGSVANVSISFSIRPQNRLQPNGNRLRNKKEKKGRSYAAANIYRGLLKIFNKTYGEFDELRDIWEIFRDNAYVDSNGDVVFNIDQLGYDLVMNELQDRAIGKVMGKYREALENNPTWHALSAP